MELPGAAIETSSGNEWKKSNTELWSLDKDKAKEEVKEPEEAQAVESGFPRRLEA